MNTYTQRYYQSMKNNPQKSNFSKPPPAFVPCSARAPLKVAALASLGSRPDRESFAVFYLLVLKKTIPLQWNRHGEFAEGMTTLQGNLSEPHSKVAAWRLFLCFCLQCSQISVKNLRARGAIPPKRQGVWAPPVHKDTGVYGFLTRYMTRLPAKATRLS